MGLVHSLLPGRVSQQVPLWEEAHVSECIYHRFLSFSASLERKLAHRLTSHCFSGRADGLCEVVLACSHNVSSGNLSSREGSEPTVSAACTDSVCRCGGHGAAWTGPPPPRLSAALRLSSVPRAHLGPWLLAKGVKRKRKPHTWPGAMYEREMQM